MKRTHATPLIGLAAAGAVIGFLIEFGTAAAGAAVFVPPVSLPITLVVIAILVVAFAIPIRRAVRGTSTRPIDPFQAMRVVVLAKACSLAGALLTGAGAGVLVYFLSRAVVPGGTTLAPTIATTIAAALLLLAGLIAEYLCMLPPDDKDDPEKVHAQAP
jgi:hypothetical protein